MAEPDRLAGAIEEIMRYESPVPSGGGRWASRDTVVNGVPLKQGEMVFLCWASANLDPATFAQPFVDRAGEIQMTIGLFAVPEKLARNLQTAETCRAQANIPVSQDGRMSCEGLIAF